MTLLMKAQHEDEFESMAKRMGKWVHRALGANYHRFGPAEAWNPAINLYEDDEQYHIIVDLSGVKPDKIDIRVDEKGVLMLEGVRDMPDVPCPAGSIKMHLMEIDQGPFCRSLDLPDDADIDNIEATYKTGLLWIRVPKKD